MYTISSAILSLLYEHDCVIVPGLGAFLSRRVGSKFDEQRGLMLPPRKEVVFNAEIVHTDGLLADFLSDKGGMEYEAAVKSIEAFVEDVLKKMEGGTVVMLPELGSLKMEGGRVVFEAEAGLNVLIDSYGLSPVAAERVRADVFEGVSSQGMRKAVASVAAVVALLLVTPRTSDPLFVQASFSQAFADMKRTTAMEEAAAMEKVREEESRVVESSPEMIEANVAKEEAKVRSVAAAVEDEVQGKETYYLVVASFLARQEAQDYIASMRAKGVTDLDILDYGGRCRVVAASYDNLSAANAGNRDLRTVSGFEKSWVLRVTSK